MVLISGEIDAPVNEYILQVINEINKMEQMNKRRKTFFIQRITPTNLLS